MRELLPQLPRDIYSVAQRTAGLDVIAASRVTRTDVHSAHRQFELDALREAAA
jgi:hypothetical protein